MLIYKCDICGNQFKPYTLNDGQNVFSSFNHYEMSNVLTGGQPASSLRVFALMLCSDCGREVNKKIDEMKPKQEVGEKKQENEKVENKTGEQTPKKDK